ncbi:cyclic lactone autoinducer peptide [Paenibacillus sp. GCM10012307]|uniref:Cyclic lactone autoinducer peptide n=1 Tax=Paenibacillus roseus TaxID=2798579 RepID=A0A934JAM1_9BACL|nr:cyclic lactone autoinducer peptide [Paenibacillus roseus]MBJ6363328.1 cyclic lactone autoinducer peptide [Paenibacillus roseus]
MSKRALSAFATMLSFTALLSVTTASFLWGNQPEVPKELLT